jgi:hypothetical protein
MFFCSLRLEHALIYVFLRLEQYLSSDLIHERFFIQKKKQFICFLTSILPFVFLINSSN